MNKTRIVPSQLVSSIPKMQTQIRLESNVLNEWNERIENSSHIETTAKAASMSTNKPPPPCNLGSPSDSRQLNRYNVSLVIRRLQVAFPSGPQKYFLMTWAEQTFAIATCIKLTTSKAKHHFSSQLEKFTWAGFELASSGFRTAALKYSLHITLRMILKYHG